MKKVRRSRKRNNSPALIIMLFIGLAAMLAYLGAHLLTEDEPSLQPSSQASEPDDFSSSQSQEPSSAVETSSSDVVSASSEPLAEPSSSQQSSGTTQKDWRLLLVSKNSRLSSELNVELTELRGFKVDKRIKAEFEQMLNDAAAQGIKLSIVSTYRPFSRSAYLYDTKVGEYLAAGYTQQQAEKEASMWVAPPGTSEHVTGLAADIVSGDYYTKLSELLPEFSEFEEAKWLKANCATYGFILRYPEGKENITGVYFEPWHFRYVGVEHAKKIMEQGITLEEYLQQLGE